MLIAGSSSGAGKTTVALVIIAALRRRGLDVQPFKCGPDFLDTGHLTRIAGRAARNLDTWMLPADANLHVVQGGSLGADAIVAEGMMGLFDGKDGTRETGSSAEIAKLLKLPVVLVLDARNIARSIAAIVLGFEAFDPELCLAGVILNRVANERHYRMLETAITSRCKTRVLGWLPRDPAISISERHLGLQTVEEADNSIEAMDGLIDRMAKIAEDHLDLDRVLSLECGLPLSHQPASELLDHNYIARVGVARDRAFSFYYEDNLDLMRDHGAEIVSFSPMHDEKLPADLDALYLGGGYPELYAEQLSSNQSMLSSIRAFAESGRPVYAECGGMMYLSAKLYLLDGTERRMAGVLPLAIEMTSGLVQFGYVTVTFARNTILGPLGVVVRGHSFHHSRIKTASASGRSYLIHYSLSGNEEMEGYGEDNVLASYVHLHFRAYPLVAKHFIDAAMNARTSQLVPR